MGISGRKNRSWRDAAAGTEKRNQRLDTVIEVGKHIDTIEYDYPTFHLSMQCFWCTIVEGNLVLKEHEAAKWLDKEHLYSVDWLPADIGLIGKIEKDM